ncbi:MAG: Gfo/Idh/MocA family oxidoreductase [Pseudomonadota bacterium]
MTLNVALIGTGMVAGTHVAAIDASEKVTLKGVLARTPESTKRVANKHGVQAYHDVEAIAADTEVSFVIIATPPNARLELIETLARAGKPILLEKPVARDLPEAKVIVDRCAKADIPLGIVFQHRMRDASQKATDLVASGELGALGVASLDVPWWREQAYYDEPGRGTYARDGGGVLISQAIHTIDLALSLTGPVANVQAMTATSRFHAMEAEDFAAAGLTFSNGAVGSLTASTASYPGGAETITLHFERASLHLGSGILTVSWRDGRVESLGASATTGGGADPMAFTHEWHQGIIEDFAGAIDSGRNPVVTGEQALASHLLIDAIERSAKSGKRVELEQ